MPLSKCQNANCGREVTTLRPLSVEGHKNIRLCSECCSYAVRNGQLRSKGVVQRTELMKRNRKRTKESSKHDKVPPKPRGVKRRLEEGSTGPREVNLRLKKAARRPEGKKKEKIQTKVPKIMGKCQNPGCDNEEMLGRILTDDGYLRVCKGCGSYWTRYGALRSEATKKWYNDLKERRKEKGTVCPNPNCGAQLDVVGNSHTDSELVVGGYSHYDGKYYCATCAIYLDGHNGEQRPKKFVEQQKRRKAAKKTGLAVCENSECREKVRGLVEFKFEDRDWVRLCHKCYYYAKLNGILRSKEVIKQKKKLKDLRKPKGDRCANPNCRTADLEHGRYSTFDGEFYCGNCGHYANKHGGEQRPASLVKRIPVHFKECGNPNCSFKSAHLKLTKVEGHGQVSMCRLCSIYATLNGIFRPKELIERLEKAGQPKVCHNANCRETNIVGGRYSKTNEEYYCGPCGAYLDGHGGEERPMKLIEEQKTRKSRYVWKMNHPWEDEEDSGEV